MVKMNSQMKMEDTCQMFMLKMRTQRAFLRSLRGPALANTPLHSDAASCRPWRSYKKPVCLMNQLVRNKSFLLCSSFLGPWIPLAVVLL